MKQLKRLNNMLFDEENDLEENGLLKENPGKGGNLEGYSITMREKMNDWQSNMDQFNLNLVSVQNESNSFELLKQMLYK